MKVLIVEDEIDARKVLRYLLHQLFSDIQIVGEATSVEDAKIILDQENPDLVFLDIQLEDGTGFDLLSQLKDINFSVVFTTAYNNYAIKAIKFDAIDYLLKPVNPEELKIAVQKVRNYLQKLEAMQQLQSVFQKSIQATNIITIKTAEQTFLVPEEDIIRLEADGAYTTIITLDNTIVTSKNIKYYQKNLPETLFIRPHQSHLVNKKHIIGLNKAGELILSNKEVVPVAFRKKSLIRNLLKNNN